MTEEPTKQQETNPQQESKKETTTTESTKTAGEPKKKQMPPPKPIKPLMKKVRLAGHSKLRMNRMTLGCMHFGSSWKDLAKCGSSKEEAEKVFLRFIEAGGFCFDTANLYQHGKSEEWLGEFIRKHKIPRDDLVIATKYSGPRPNGKGANMWGNQKKSLHCAIKESLKRLQMDYVDILYVHFHDFVQTGSEFELMLALNDLIKQGIVLHIGLSDAPAHVLTLCNVLAQERGLEGFTIYQGCHSLVGRTMEHEIFDACRRLNVAVTPWGVLGGGALVSFDKKEKKSSRLPDDFKFSEKEEKIRDEVLKIAEELKVKPILVTLAWSMAKTTTILLGARTVEQLNGNLEALDVELSEEHMKRLDAVSEPPVVFPYDMKPRLKVFNSLLNPEPYEMDESQPI